MNNQNMTMEEMAEIAYGIINEDAGYLNEDLVNGLQKFQDNYERMRELLKILQDAFMKKAKTHHDHSRLMGDGSFTKAYNLARKVDYQLKKMNKDAEVFISVARDALK